MDPDKPIKRMSSGYVSSRSEEKENGTKETPTYVRRADEDIEESQTKRVSFWTKYRPFILAGIAVVILGWWISATIMKATRHRW